MSSVIEHVEVARAESERGELVLRRRREDGGPAVLELRVDGVRTRDTREVGTELALAQAALASVPDPRAVVVGGLGLGTTLDAVLADPRVERAAVVEVEEALVGWMRDGTVPHGPTLLADERVHVVVADLAVALAEARPATYDLVLLDGVDHGEPLLRAARAALRPGGAVAIGSAQASGMLEEALRAAFGDCEAVPVSVPDAATCWLHIARVP